MISYTKGCGDGALWRDCDNLIVLSSLLCLFSIVFFCFAAVIREAHKAGACFWMDSMGSNALDKASRALRRIGTRGGVHRHVRFRELCNGDRRPLKGQS